MSIRNIVIRWYGVNDKTVQTYIPVIMRFYNFMINDIKQWIDNKHSIKKYVNIHFKKHFDSIYDHVTPPTRKDSISGLLSSQMGELDEKILARLINVIDKIFSDICKGNLEKNIKTNKEYWVYFSNIIKPGYKTV